MHVHVCVSPLLCGVWVLGFGGSNPTTHTLLTIRGFIVAVVVASYLLSLQVSLSYS